jgi:hypothetical protein
VKIGSAERPRVSSQHVVGEELVAPKLILNRRERKGNRFIFLYLEVRIYGNVRSICDGSG